MDQDLRDGWIQEHLVCKTHGKKPSFGFMRGVDYRTPPILQQQPCGVQLFGPPPLRRKIPEGALLASGAVVERTPFMGAPLASDAVAVRKPFMDALLVLDDKTVPCWRSWLANIGIDVRRQVSVTGLPVDEENIITEFRAVDQNRVRMTVNTGLGFCNQRLHCVPYVALTFRRWFRRNLNAQQEASLQQIRNQAENQGAKWVDLSRKEPEILAEVTADMLPNLQRFLKHDDPMIRAQSLRLLAASALPEEELHATIRQMRTDPSDIVQLMAERLGAYFGLSE